MTAPDIALPLVIRGVEIPNSRKCKLCLYTYFGRDRVACVFKVEQQNSGRQAGQTHLRLICSPCIRRSKSWKLACQWKQKAKATRKAHARNDHLGVSATVLRERYGWDIAVMARDAKLAWDANSCAYCGGEMRCPGTVLRFLTLDIVDPAQPPAYGKNTKWVCLGCNAKKGNKSPSEWTLYQRVEIEHSQWLTWMEHARGRCMSMFPGGMPGQQFGLFATEKSS